MKSSLKDIRFLRGAKPRGSRFRCEIPAGYPSPPPFSAKNRIKIDLALVPLRPETFWAGGNPFVFSGGFRVSILRIDYLDGGCRSDEGLG